MYSYTLNPVMVDTDDHNNPVDAAVNKNPEYSCVCGASMLTDEDP